MAEVHVRPPSRQRSCTEAVEVVANRPEKPAEWEAIATRLSTVFSSEEKTVEFKGMGYKNKIELLLAKAEDARNLKRFILNIFLNTVGYFIYKQEQFFYYL